MIIIGKLDEVKVCAKTEIAFAITIIVTSKILLKILNNIIRMA